MSTTATIVTVLSACVSLCFWALAWASRGSSSPNCQCKNPERTITHGPVTRNSKEN